MARLHQKKLNKKKTKKTELYDVLLNKEPTHGVWTKRTNPFFTLTYSKYHNQVGSSDDMPPFSLPTSQFAAVM